MPDTATAIDGSSTAQRRKIGEVQAAIMTVHGKARALSDAANQRRDQHRAAR